MDLGKTLHDLYAARERLEHVISALQGIQQEDAMKPPPWPEPMGPPERETGTERTKRCGTRRKPAH